MPVKAPLAGSNDAQLGAPVMLNCSALPLGSLVFGRNEYAVPTTVAAGGEPLIVGAALPGAVPPLAPGATATLPQPASAAMSAAPTV